MARRQMSVEPASCTYHEPARHTCLTCGRPVVLGAWTSRTTFDVMHEQDGVLYLHEHQQVPQRAQAVREQGRPRATRQPFDGERLRRARDRRRLSMRQAAALLGVARWTYSCWESGWRWPSDVMLDRIAEELPDALPTQPRRERVDDRQEAQRQR